VVGSGRDRGSSTERTSPGSTGTGRLEVAYSRRVTFVDPFRGSMARDDLMESWSRTDDEAPEWRTGRIPGPLRRVGVDSGTCRGRSCSCCAGRSILGRPRRSCHCAVVIATSPGSRRLGAHKADSRVAAGKPPREAVRLIPVGNLAVDGVRGIDGTCKISRAGRLFRPSTRRARSSVTRPEDATSGDAAMGSRIPTSTDCEASAGPGRSVGRRSRGWEVVSLSRCRRALAEPRRPAAGLRLAVR